MLKESEVKKSRGWKYKEIKLDFSEKDKNKDKMKHEKPLKGVQLSMFH